jgi:hypothetical protein
MKIKMLWCGISRYTACSYSRLSASKMKKWKGRTSRAVILERAELVAYVQFPVRKKPEQPARPSGPGASMSYE